MLSLERLEVQGFGPFAETQTIEFPSEKGVVVVYGENMRGKTSLLNAIRFAFFGTVLGRGARERRLHTVSNRELAAEGKYGFSVALTFVFNGDRYDLVRECVPSITTPQSDQDYQVQTMLRRGATVLGPGEREKLLALAFPREISRFFLFDGELLQEYEELLINESEAGRSISESIERILGVPILKRGRVHLTYLAERLDKEAAKEARKHQETQALGNALQDAIDRRDAHQLEIGRMERAIGDLSQTKAEIEERMQGTRKYAAVIAELDRSQERLIEVDRAIKAKGGDLQRAMAGAWRSVLREIVRSARVKAHEDVEREIGALQLRLRARAVETSHCEVCERDLSDMDRDRLRVTAKETVCSDVSTGMTDLASLNQFRETDKGDEIAAVWSQRRDLEFERITLNDRINELRTELSESDPDTIRHSQASYAHVMEKITTVRNALVDERTAANEIDENVTRLRKKLDSTGPVRLQTSREQARVLRWSAEVFSAAVESYKLDLKQRVEATASGLFLSMTTEKQDYAGLEINDSYGLTIMHRDGKAEDARSAGAEHVVALALMGALQNNAPLRGPIVMDSPFGRLDEEHTDNVIASLPRMAEQIVLLVYEAEVGRAKIRQFLQGSLLREYELQRQSARRTLIAQVS